MSPDVDCIYDTHPPTFYVVFLFPSHKTTDDVLHIRSLPTFDNRISPRNCELLLQYLTVPYLRIPLVLQFFARHEHVTALACNTLQEVLDSCLFEPGQWQADLSKAVPTQIPPPNRSHLATSCGLLFNELVYSPKNVITSIEKMLELILDHDTGRYSETSSPVILYIIRLAVQLESFIIFLLDQEKAREIRGLACSEASLQELAEGRQRLYNKLQNVVFPVLERWYNRLIKKKDVPRACVVRAHLAYIFRNVKEEDLNFAIVSTLLSSQVFLTINFKFDVDISLFGGDNKDRGGEEWHLRKELGVPQLEVFNLFTMHRAKVLLWLQKNPAECDEVMEAVIRIATLTGTRDIPKDRELKPRHWESMSRHGCVGRFLPDTELKGVMEMIKVCGYTYAIYY